VGVLKPVETGVGPEGPLDAIALREAAGLEVAIDEVCPQHFALPAAPSVAAAAEGRRVDRRSIDVAMQRGMAAHECVIVEGAGGLLVPLAEGFSMADLALRHRLSLLVVCRASLGTLNHTRITAMATHSEAEIDSLADAVAEEIARHS
jgi:dethiobiotin synthetase